MSTITHVDANALVNEIAKLTKGNMRLKVLLAAAIGVMLAMKVERDKLKAEIAELKKVEVEGE